MTHPHDEAQLRRRTRLALSAAAAELSDELLALVTTFGEEGLEPGSYTAMVRRMDTLAKRLRILAVLNDRIILGATWLQIASMRGLTVDEMNRVYQPMEDRWRAGNPAPWAPQGGESDGKRPAATSGFLPVDITSDNSRAVASYLDRYCRDRLRDNAPRGEQPVTTGLPAV